MKREEIKRKADFIYANYHGAERQRRIQQFIASLGKERHEQLAQQAIAEFGESLEKMYGRSAPKSIPETGSRQIEERIAKEGIPREVLVDRTLIEPFKSLAILERSVKKGKTIKKSSKKIIEDFEEWLKYKLGK